MICRMVPLGILAIVFSVLFEVYKKDFERWVKPLTDWLREREAWSWTLPTAILVILSFPPLFGHEIVQLIVGVSSEFEVQVWVDELTALIADVSAWRCYWDCVCGGCPWRSGMLVSPQPVHAELMSTGTNFALALPLSICSPVTFTRKSTNRSSGRPWLESPRKLGSVVCW